MAENEKETKAEKKNRLLRKELEIRDHKDASREQAVDKLESEVKGLKEQNTSLLKKMHSRALEERETKTEQVAVDSVSSTAAQVSNIAIQSLINYAIKKLPESAGKHPVIIKSIPPAVTFAWYAIELITMKKENRLPKRMRLQAATILTNLGFLQLAQTFLEDQGDKKAATLALSQDNAAVAARNQKLAEELANAKKLLEQNGIKS